MRGSTPWVIQATGGTTACGAGYEAQGVDDRRQPVGKQVGPNNHPYSRNKGEGIGLKPDVLVGMGVS